MENGEICKESRPLGMENDEISDDQITSSSDFDLHLRAANGRLNSVAGNDKTAWSSQKDDLNPWLQVDFQRSTIITGISTQGRQGSNQFVKSYTISFSDNGKDFTGYKLGKILKVSWIGEQNITPGSGVTWF